MMNSTEAPLYVLTRTSGRQAGFSRLRKSVKALMWPGGVIHIVHTDDPCDTYVEGNCDIIVRGESLLDLVIPSRPAPYNYYCNRLLDTVKALSPGWVHFIDDDDEYVSEDVFLRLLEGRQKDYIIAGRVHRGGSVYYPRYWGKQQSFQTEIPAYWSDIALSGRWPLTKGGDHHYTRQLTKKYPILWMSDVLIATTFTGKGRGHRRDEIGNLQEDEVLRCPPLEKDAVVFVKSKKRVRVHSSIEKTTYGDYLKRRSKREELLLTYIGVTAEGSPLEGSPEFDRDLPPLLEDIRKNARKHARGTIDLGVTKHHSRTELLGLGRGNHQRLPSHKRRK